MRNLKDEILKASYDRARTGQNCSYLIVDVDTFQMLKTLDEFVPSYYQQDPLTGDTFVGLKLAVRYEIDFGWRIA